MSQAALDLLASDDSSPEETSASKRAISLLEGKTSVPEAPRKTPSLYMAPVGGAEMLAKRVTGTVASIPAGITYGGAAIGRALGMDVDPRAAMADVQNYLTYQPQTESGQAGEAELAYLVHPVVDPIASAADRAASRVGNISPTAETLLREAPAAAGAAGGILGLTPFVAPATQLLRAAPGAVTSGARAARSVATAAGRKVAEAGEAVSDAAVRAVGGKVPPKPITPDVNPFERESLGAAAAVPTRLQTASPELQAAVRAEARAGGVDRAALDRHLEADSIGIRLTEGQATQDPVKISEEANRRGKDTEFAARFHEQNQQLIDKLDEFRREAAPGSVGNDPVQNGQQLIDSYKTYDQAVREDISSKYQALRDANGGELPIDGQKFVANADVALKKAFKGRYVPKEIAADLDAIRNGEVAMNFEQFENLRTNLAAEARKADRAGDGNAAAAVNIVREQLESLPMTGEAANLKPLADAARQAAKARFDRLRADPAYRAAAEDDVGVGESSVLADDFIHKYVVKGKSANVDRMRETLASDPTADETIAAGALNYLKSKSGVNMYTNEGNFSQAGYNRALSELEPKLESLVGPDTADKARTLGNVARYVQAQPRGSFVNNSNTTVAAHAMGLAKGAAERGVNAILPGADLGTLARERIEKRAEKKAVREALKPGAGIGMKPRQ